MCSIEVTGLYVIMCRAFNRILKEDHAAYGAEEDYEIPDTVANEWQQHIDNVIGE